MRKRIDDDCAYIIAVFALSPSPTATLLFEHREQAWTVLSSEQYDSEGARGPSRLAPSVRFAGFVCDEPTTFFGNARRDVAALEAVPRVPSAMDAAQRDHRGDGHLRVVRARTRIAVIALGL